MRCITYFAIILMSSLPTAQAMKRESLRIRTKDNTYTFSIERTETAREKAKGLKHRLFLSPHHGMLFLFARPKEGSMWMKDTKLSLDMLFFNETGDIIHIHEKATPLSTDIIAPPSSQKIKGVLEINGGEAAELGISIGDKIHHYLLPTSPEK